MGYFSLKARQQTVVMPETRKPCGFLMVPISSLFLTTAGSGVSSPSPVFTRGPVEPNWHSSQWTLQSCWIWTMNSFILTAAAMWLFGELVSARVVNKQKTKFMNGKVLMVATVELGLNESLLIRGSAVWFPALPVYLLKSPWARYLTLNCYIEQCLRYWSVCKLNNINVILLA